MKIDLSRSENIKSHRIDWPSSSLMETKIADEILKSYVYEGDSTIPISIVPEDASKPMLLNIQIHLVHVMRFV